MSDPLLPTYQQLKLIVLVVCGHAEMFASKDPFKNNIAIEHICGFQWRKALPEALANVREFYEAENQFCKTPVM